MKRRLRRMASGMKAYIYPKTYHGFHNDTTPRYDEAAAKLAWQRTIDHFNKTLKAYDQTVAQRIIGGPTIWAVRR